jgi:C-terminal processing protease CtpA/Prc
MNKNLKTGICFMLVTLASLCHAKEFSTKYKGEIVKSLVEKIEQEYVLTEHINEIKESLHSLEKTERYTQAKLPLQFSSLLTETLKKIDKHFSIQWKDENEKPKAQPKYENWFSKLDRKNSGFNRVEILDGNIGYIDFWGFDDLNERSKKRAAAVMSIVSDSDALIFDLRSNEGGSAAMDQFISSYLFREETQLNSIYSKKTGITTDYWTYLDVDGLKNVDIPVYILISQKTFSAAEAFAYSLKVLNRAILIGETTKGGANPWQFFNLGNGYRAAIPIAKAINPITKSNWEGIGVKPNVEVESEKALSIAYEMALNNVKMMSQNNFQLKEIENKLKELKHN